MRRFVVAWVTCWALGAGAVTARAQEAAEQLPPTAAPLRVFLDCEYGCDSTYMRDEINFVDHVRDREVADVHVLITTRGTGGGGTEYTLAFIGLRTFTEVSDTLTFVTRQQDTDDDIRRGLVRTLELGLVRYLVKTPLRDRLDLTYRQPDAAEGGGRTKAAADPWDFWVFHLSTDVASSGEESQKSVEFWGDATASRVTEQWKTAISVDLNYERDSYKFDDEDEEGEDRADYVSIARNWEASGTLVKSLGSHWGAGLRGELSSSTYTNHRRQVVAAGGIEYNIFPYAETTRRQLTFRYEFGVMNARYRQVTIYDKLNETLAAHALAANWDMRQPWGTLDLEVEAFQYIPKYNRNRLSIEGDAEVRLFKGFSLDVGIDTSVIRDQIYLPAGRATPEEILLRRRQVATSYDYGIRVGFSYTFGSVFNNVVNSRLSGF